MAKDVLVSVVGNEIKLSGKCIYTQQGDIYINQWPIGGLSDDCAKVIGGATIKFVIQDPSNFKFLPDGSIAWKKLDPNDTSSPTNWIKDTYKDEKTSELYFTRAKDWQFNLRVVDGQGHEISMDPKIVNGTISLYDQILVLVVLFVVPALVIAGLVQIYRKFFVR